MPRIVDHTERRVELLEGFFRQVLQVGIAGVTSRAIAREAGVSVGVLWHYFADMESLVLSGFELLNDRFSARLQAAARARTTAADALTAICLEALPLDAPRRIESGVWLCFWAYGYANEAVRKRQAAGYDVWTHTLARLIAGVRRTGARSAMPTAVELAALIDGLTIQMMLRSNEPSAATVEEVVRQRIAALS